MIIRWFYLVILKEGKAGWYHVTGKASSKQYVKEHGEKVTELLANDWREALKEGKMRQVHLSYHRSQLYKCELNL